MDPAAACSAWVTVTVSSSKSVSSSPVTVIVCAELWLPEVKVKAAGATVAAILSPLLGVMITSPPTGWMPRDTV